MGHFRGHTKPPFSYNQYFYGLLSIITHQVWRVNNCTIYFYMTVLTIRFINNVRLFRPMMSSYFDKIKSTSFNTNLTILNFYFWMHCRLQKSFQNLKSNLIWILSMVRQKRTQQSTTRFGMHPVKRNAS